MRIILRFTIILFLVQIFVTDIVNSWRHFNQFRGYNNRYHRLSLKPQILSKLSSTSTDADGHIAMKNPEFIFIGGKGGVGKTTSSASMAVGLSDKGLKTLVISTDPAHSLGDSLDVDLSSGLITPVLSEKNLWALEIDVEREYHKFADQLQQLSSQTLSERLNLPKNMFDDIGIADLAKALKNPPPGVDEVIALTEIFKFANQYKQSNHSNTTTPQYDFDRIIIDTAPTGHTVRLFQIPEFFDSVLKKVLRVKARATKIIRTMKQMIDVVDEDELYEPDEVVDLDKLDIFQESIATLQAFQTNIHSMKRMMKDPQRTQFLIVTIPTQLAVEESLRLINNLKDMDIAIQSMICNQIITPEANEAYLSTRINGQEHCIEAMQNFLDKHPQGYNLSHIQVNTIPYIDAEITSVYGLRYLQPIAHAPVPYGPTNPLNSRLLTIFGGKGGVGKTTASSSYALGLSDAGFKTLLVSTDPAHSLGDIFRQRFSDQPTLVDRSSASTGSAGGSLWVMEIDPKLAIQQFQSLYELYRNETQAQQKEKEADEQRQRNELSENKNKAEPTRKNFSMKDFFIEAGILLSDEAMKAQEEERKEEEASKGHIFFDLQQPPPGSDEVIALSKLIQYLEYGYNHTETGERVFFDRIVIDTAPTGHTLRMLQLPRFLQMYLQTILSLESKLQFVINDEEYFTADHQYLLDNRTDSTQAIYTNSMQELLLNLHTLEALLHQENTTEFTIVTIPTELGIAETKRLVNTLHERDISMRRIIINQVLPKFVDTTTLQQQSEEVSTTTQVIAAAKEKAAEVEEKIMNYFEKVRNHQSKMLQQVRILAGRQQVPLLELPYNDVELRTVKGLRSISEKILPLIATPK